MFVKYFEPAKTPEIPEIPPNTLKIEQGHYNGNGLYGTDNPNTLTFELEPKIVYLFCQSYHPCTALTGENLGGAAATNAVFYKADDNRAMEFSIVGGGTVLGEVTYEIVGNTLTWSSTSAPCQFNTNMKRYYYIAIGT